MGQDRLQSADDLEVAFLKWNGGLFGYVFVRVRDKGIAEDITQEVFLKAWKARSSFDPRKASLKTWLYTIALNTTRDYFRRQKGKVIVEIHDEIPTDLLVNIVYEDAEQRSEVWAHIHKLSGRDQELISLRYVQELSIKEICPIVGKKESAVKVGLHRAVEKLRDFCNQNASTS